MSTRIYKLLSRQTTIGREDVANDPSDVQCFLWRLARLCSFSYGLCNLGKIMANSANAVMFVGGAIKAPIFPCSLGNVLRRILWRKEDVGCIFLSSSVWKCCYGFNEGLNSV